MTNLNKNIAQVTIYTDKHNNLCTYLEMEKEWEIWVMKTQMMPKDSTFIHLICKRTHRFILQNRLGIEGKRNFEKSTYTPPKNKK